MDILYIQGKPMSSHSSTLSSLWNSCPLSSSEGANLIITYLYSCVLQCSLPCLWHRICAKTVTCSWLSYFYMAPSEKIHFSILLPKCHSTFSLLETELLRIIRKSVTIYFIPLKYKNTSDYNTLHELSNIKWCHKESSFPTSDATVFYIIPR